MRAAVAVAAMLTLAACGEPAMQETSLEAERMPVMFEAPGYAVAGEDVSRFYNRAYGADFRVADMQGDYWSGRLVFARMQSRRVFLDGDPQASLDNYVPTDGIAYGEIKQRGHAGDGPLFYQTGTNEDGNLGCVRSVRFDESYATNYDNRLPGDPYKVIIGLAVCQSGPFGPSEAETVLGGVKPRA